MCVCGEALWGGTLKSWGVLLGSVRETSAWKALLGPTIRRLWDPLGGVLEGESARPGLIGESRRDPMKVASSRRWWGLAKLDWGRSRDPSAGDNADLGRRAGMGEAWSKVVGERDRGLVRGALVAEWAYLTGSPSARQTKRTSLLA